MVVNILTPDDLQAFKEGLLEDLARLLEQHKTPTPAGRKYLKSHEVRRLLKISPSTMQRFRKNGSLPYTLIGGTYYYDAADIERLIADNKITQPRRGRLLPGEEPERKRRKP
jgi:hypothetical protein